MNNENQHIDLWWRGWVGRGMKLWDLSEQWSVFSWFNFERRQNMDERAYRFNKSSENNHNLSFLAFPHSVVTFSQATNDAKSGKLSLPPRLSATIEKSSLLIGPWRDGINASCTKTTSTTELQILPSILGFRLAFVIFDLQSRLNWWHFWCVPGYI